MFEKLLSEFVQYGALGLVAAVSLLQLWFIQKQLIKLIQDNTQVTAQVRDGLRELKETIKDCQLIHKEERHYKGEREK